MSCRPARDGRSSVCIQNTPRTPCRAPRPRATSPTSPNETDRRNLRLLGTCQRGSRSGSSRSRLPLRARQGQGAGRGSLTTPAGIDDAVGAEVLPSGDHAVTSTEINHPVGPRLRLPQLLGDELIGSSASACWSSKGTPAMPARPRLPFGSVARRQQTLQMIQ